MNFQYENLINMKPERHILKGPEYGYLYCSEVISHINVLEYVSQGTRDRAS